MKPLYIPKGERRESVTVKLSREQTGLNGSVFVHVEYDADGRAETIALSEKGKDGSTLDNLFILLSKTLTGMLRA